MPIKTGNNFSSQTPLTIKGVNKYQGTPSFIIVDNFQIIISPNIF